MKSKQITRHWTELSAYIDGQLPQKKAARLEKRLSQDSALRVEYQDLLRTRSMLRSLPSRHVPRNFTLTPDMVRAPRRRIFSFLVPALRLSSSAAALMLALTFALEFMGGGPLMAKMAQDAAPAPAMEMMMEEAPAGTAEEPMILLWGQQPAPGLGGAMAPEVDGMGGGPQGEVPLADAAPELETMVMEEAAPAAEAPMPSAAEEVERALPPDEGEAAMEAPAAEMPAANALPAATATPAPMGTQQTEAEVAPQDEAAVSEKAYTEESAESIILGIPPEEEQGQIQATEPPVPAPIPVESSRMPARRWLQVGLGAFAVVAMLTSFLLPRKKY